MGGKAFEVDPDIHFSNLSRWAAGAITLNSPKPGFPIIEALAALRGFKVEYGRPPTASSWTAAGMTPCEKTIRNRFGSFRKAIAAAGLS